MATECVLATAVLKDGLLKARPAWSDVEVNPNLKFVLFKVSEGALKLRASNLSTTVEVSLPLYGKCPNPGTFGLIGEQILDIVKASDTLVTLSVDDSYVCTVKTRGYEWILQGKEDFPLGDSFKETSDPNSTPVRVPRGVFLKSLEVCESCMSSDPAAANMYGIALTPNSVQSTDSRRIAIFRKGTGAAVFTVPARMVPILKTLLDYGVDEHVQLRANSRQVEVTVGSDVVVFGQMGCFVNIDAIASQLEVFQPKFQVDRDSFILGLKRAGLLGDKKSAISIARAGEDIRFVAYNGAKKMGEGTLRVTWKTPDMDFCIKLNWKIVNDVLGILDSQIINFGVGEFRGNQFLRLDEDDRTIIVLSVVA